MVRGNAGQSRKRLSPDALLRRDQEIVRRHKRGESPRDIEKSLGVPRMTAWRVVKSFEAKAQADDDDDDDESLDDFNQAWFDALPRLSKVRFELNACAQDLMDDPANELALFRAGMWQSVMPEHRVFALMRGE